MTLDILLFIGLMVFLLAKEASIRVWLVVYTVLLLLTVEYVPLRMVYWILLGVGFVALSIIACHPLRRRLLSRPILKAMQRVVPAMSSTERIALEAGTVGVEAALFSGAPDFQTLLATPLTSLTNDEQAFLDGPVNTVCRMINDWEITHYHTDLPAAVWDYLKQAGFFGMIIPKTYGGLGFSATAQAAVLVKLYSVSVTVATTVGVPNALGPAELLLAYGTNAQKNYYLPRLASGEDMPCFALTSPHAGSDAAAIPDVGIVCKDVVDGEEILGIRLNWDKRYITLCPVATIIGLAFRLFDPDNLLGKGVDIGITCALIPADCKGVEKGRRHFPLNTGFLNGPTRGHDVFISMDAVIGGAAMVGEGWRMLMTCLSAGRAISLPSSAVGGSQAAVLGASAYARIRRQFGASIAQFEGIEAPLARIAGNAYISAAGLFMTTAAIDQGAKPSVAGAILKYHTTERARQTSIDTMDILGGKGICLGPNNFAGRGYQSAPIGITVEGANILTRNLIIFGQGVMRCHPYIYAEMEAIRDQNLVAFDKIFWQHAGFIVSNVMKSIGYNFGLWRLSRAPRGIFRRDYQRINFYSTTLACLSDFALGLLGGGLKRKEYLSARLGDILSALYLATAVLKRFDAEGSPVEDIPLVQWCLATLFDLCETAIVGFIANFPNRIAAIVMRCLVQPLGHAVVSPSDMLSHEIAQAMTRPSLMRARLTHYVFSEDLDTCPVGRLEACFQQVYEIEALEKRVLNAVKAGEIHELTFLKQIDAALQMGLVDDAEALKLHQVEQLRQRVLAVDDFDDLELRRSEELPATYLSNGGSADPQMIECQ